MKFNFKKIASVLATTVMLGSTVAFAAAAWPAPFVKDGAADAAVVYGAASTDFVAATELGAALESQVTTSSAVKAGDIKLTEDEVTLGGVINASGSKIISTIEDNKLSALADDKLSWDDGTGVDEYNYHEEIDLVGNMSVITTVNDEKLSGTALTNEQALEYKFVFDDAMNYSAVGENDSDTLYLTIMGQEYEIEDMAATSITVTTSKEISMSVGQEYMQGTKKVTLVDVFDGSIEVSVDGKTEVINEGNTKRINGVRVHAETVGYHSNSPETSKAVVKIGEDISKTYSSGDEYIGQDEDDPLWVWDIANLDSAGGYIGVKYNAKINSANDDVAGDSIKYVGQGYTFPNNYAAVTLDSLTAAKYQDLKVYFEDSVDLFNYADSSTAMAESKPVLVIEGANTDTLTTGGNETDKVYLYLNTTAAAFQTFYRDFDGDRTPSGKMRLANASVATITASNATSEVPFATIQIGDTDLTARVSVTNGIGTVAITNDDASNAAVVNLTLGGNKITNTTYASGTLEGLGTSLEDAQASDIIFANTNVGTKEYDYMDSYGIKLADGSTAKAEADADVVELSVPEEQVYAQVTVSMGAVVDASSSSIKVVKDTEVDSVKDKNLVVVGGSCINTVAAQILGSSTPLCGAAFSDKTGAGVDKYLVQVAASPVNSQKIAMLVAGYEAADTAKAVAKVKEGKESTEVGKVVYPLSSA